MVKIERLCGWHGFGLHRALLDKHFYLTIGYWLVIFKAQRRA